MLGFTWWGHFYVNLLIPNIMGNLKGNDRISNEPGDCVDVSFLHMTSVHIQMSFSYEDEWNLSLLSLVCCVFSKSSTVILSVWYLSHKVACWFDMFSYACTIIKLKISGKKEKKCQNMFSIDNDRFARLKPFTNSSSVNGKKEKKRKRNETEIFIIQMTHSIEHKLWQVICRFILLKQLFFLLASKINIQFWLLWRSVSEKEFKMVLWMKETLSSIDAAYFVPSWNLKCSRFDHSRSTNIDLFKRKILCNGLWSNVRRFDAKNISNWWARD